MRVRIGLTTCLLASSLSAEERIQFLPREVSEHIYTGGWEHFVGGGVATFDCNGDGLLDAFLAGGANPSALWVNATKGKGQSVQFVEKQSAATNLHSVTGAYPIDIDSDGYTDLAILRVGQDVLLRGKGDCTFASFGAELNFNSGDQWTTAFSATWEKGQALPTLAFGTYVDRTNPDGPFEACDSTLLYRPAAEGYGTPDVLAPGYCALSMLFTDWQRNGRQDLRISNDRHYYVRGGQEQLWAMEIQPRLFTREEGWMPYQLWGMGIASRDISGDGYSDVYLTSMGDQKFQLFTGSQSAPKYENVPYETGAAAHRPYEGGDGRPSTGWHAAFGDIQNDGLDDIFVAKGNVDQMPDAAMDDPNNLLIQIEGGTFVERGDVAGVGSTARSRGAALADFNLDGKLDLIVVNRRSAAQVFENASTSGNWVSIDLHVEGRNRNGIGYFLEVQAGGKTWAREITVGGGHASGTLAPQHFGLGAVESARVRVIRPDQSQSDWIEIDLNDLTRLVDDGLIVRSD